MYALGEAVYIKPVGKSDLAPFSISIFFFAFRLFPRYLLPRFPFLSFSFFRSMAVLLACLGEHGDGVRGFLHLAGY